MKYGIIGGTGVYGGFSTSREECVKTPYGEFFVYFVEDEGASFVFLPRHGKTHNKPPHLVNYRGNIWALKELGVSKVVTTAAVGSMNEKFKIGDLVLINYFIDMTKNRPGTFFDGEKGVVHVSMQDPYCKGIRSILKKKSSDKNLEIAGEGVYVCTEGPRFESSAEIRFYHQIGGDVVGMTSVPEVVLAKKAGLCYGAVGIVTNWCTGMVMEEASATDILNTVNNKKEALTQLFVEIFNEGLFDNMDCNCKDALVHL